MANYDCSKELNNTSIQILNKNTSPFFQNVSLVIWPFTLMKRTHFSGLSISKFSRYIRKAVVTKTKTPKRKTQDPLQKRRSITKTNTPDENEDPLQKRRPPTKTKTHYENEDPLPKQRHITKTSSKEVAITSLDKDNVHQYCPHSFRG